MRRSIFIIIWLFIAQLASGQEEMKKAIVLINGSPYLVDVTAKGNILAIYQEVEDYLTSRESPEKMLADESKIAVKQADGIIAFESEKEPQPSFSEENQQPITYGNDQYIGFSPGRALLLKSAVDQIRRIAESVNQGQLKKIQITSYQKNNFRSRSLARNRASAIKDLLIAFGVSNSIIDTRQSAGDDGTKYDFVQVSFSQ